jgi:hypothetical protein
MALLATIGPVEGSLTATISIGLLGGFTVAVDGR